MQLGGGGCRTLTLTLTLTLTRDPFTAKNFLATFLKLNNKNIVFIYKNDTPGLVQHYYPDPSVS